MELTPIKIHRYDEQFRQKAVTEALSRGIKPAARHAKIARNTLRAWVRLYQKGADHLPIYHRHHARFPPECEKYVVSLKEKDPACTLMDIRENVKREIGVEISINGIHKILERYGMAGKSSLPFIVEATAETEHGSGFARSLIKKGDTQGAASILNALPALSDFSILEKIPAPLLSPRRQSEQLEALLERFPPAELQEKAMALYRTCRKEKLDFTAIFVATLEMSCMNRLGHHGKILALYRKFYRYLDRLISPLKYTFLMECFLSYSNLPAKFPGSQLKRLPFSLMKFCSTLPEERRFVWYDAISTCFQITGQINESLKWMEKLIQALPAEDRKTFLGDYVSLLATMGRYSEVLEHDAGSVDKTMRSFLTLSLATGNALLGTGEPEKALAVTLEAFSKAEKEHLRPAMAGFSFFIACCYAALNAAAEAKKYLKIACRLARTSRRMEQTYSLLLAGEPIAAARALDRRIRIINHYLAACRSRRGRLYTEAYRIAKKNGLLGFLHRIILLQPKAAVNLLRKGKETYLPREYLALPVFRTETPTYRLVLLREKELVLYGRKKINISVKSKDFHLLAYLFLNRKKTLPREGLAGTFYGKTINPTRSLIKAVSRIRRSLGFSKAQLKISRTGLFFDIVAKIDLEEFDERFRLGKILEKAGESSDALAEYKTCLSIYRHSPFGQMGYYYNFAEERRSVARNMLRTMCESAMSIANRRGKRNLVRTITAKLKNEHMGSDLEI